MQLDCLEQNSIYTLFVLNLGNKKTPFSEQGVKENIKFKEIASTLGLQEFVVKNAAKQGANFSDEKLSEIMNYILESEYRIKNGLIGDEAAIEILIGKYCK